MPVSTQTKAVSQLHSVKLGIQKEYTAEYQEITLGKFLKTAGRTVRNSEKRKKSVQWSYEKIDESLEK